ncbi:MAG: hypothetical protein DME61_11940 [Verrucomicrobia bacterium]|nr:MAG: hypothetical protein DME61_11940 [Verrucomicrobiota bacterium]
MSGSGNVTLGSGTLTVHVVRFPGTTYSGVISGTGGLNVIGSGANFGYLYLNGNNSYTGTTTVSGATLGGTGSIAGPVTVDSSSAMSVLAPGLPTSPFVGILNTGAVSFVGGATFSASMRGPNPGSGYTQLNVTGSVNLTNANLVTQLASSPAPVLGQVYTIINATGPVSGTFIGYPEGTLINFGFATLAISLCARRNSAYNKLAFMWSRKSGARGGYHRDNKESATLRTIGL